MPSKVNFHFLQRDFSLANRSALKRAIESLFRRQRKALGSINYIFCSDAYLLAVNVQFLKHDFYTDILSFDLSEPGRPIDAEVYISIDRVRDNAATFDSSFKRELHRVIFHGSLHLCGFDDKSPENAQIMRKMEDKCLKLYFS
jgi:probable rRNA maturation factor